MDSVRKVIVSRGRASMITTHNILKDYCTVVPESERDLYFKKCKNVITYPDAAVNGLGETRNWVLNNFNEDVVMLDDDITYIASLMRLSRVKYIKPEDVEFILDLINSNCKEAGAKLWSMNQAGIDNRKFKALEPFKMNTWVGTIVGVIKNDLRFTETNKGESRYRLYFTASIGE